MAIFVETHSSFMKEVASQREIEIYFVAVEIM